MVNCAARKDRDADEARRNVQMAINERLIQRIDSIFQSSDQDPCDQSYEAFAEFTRACISSYMPAGGCQDVRVFPMGSVYPGSHIHSQAMDHAAGHDKTFGVCSELDCAKLDPGTQYRDLVRHAALRIVKAKEAEAT